ncbi:choline kinase alpha-like [Zophobas morio]|uniref:choline kinase alpha-like n=1 Tax=Zophobas morio TaxID=2755281 RepID=UPI0030839187
MSFVILSERKVGPKLLGIFTEGHIEEFFEAKTLQPQDLCLSKISFKIAKSLARFHAIDMPLERTPSVFNTLRSWYSSARLVLENGSEYYRENRLTLVEYEKELQQLDLMKEIDFKQEVEFLVEKILSLAETPVKFCHNDVNAGNVLCLEDGSLQLIDFEYSAYNHVGFEFANHFCERIFDYSGIQEYPFFRVMLENFPDLAEQRTFLEAYLSDVPSDAEPDVRVYLAETNRFVLVCHMLWALWSIIQFDCSTIVFPYLKYASIRLDMYFQAKEQLDSLLARI